MTRDGFGLRLRLRGGSALPKLSQTGGNIMKTAILGASALTLLAGTVLANEPYLPRNAKALERMDANKDGRITPDELKPRFDKRFAAVDSNGDKMMTAAEIDAMLQKRMEMRRTRMLQLMDANKDGSVSQAEFARVADDMFDKADTDHDGGVNLAELQTFKRAQWRKAFLGQPAKP
jgi:Secreted protein acidic and rich in cysteine Ca binding region